MVYHESCALFCLLLSNVPDIFFSATHQAKAIAVGISKNNPLAEIS